MASDGFDLALHYHQSKTEVSLLAAEVEASGQRAVVLSADLAEPAGMAALVDLARDAIGPLSLLVNNASLFAKDSLGNMTPAGWCQLIDVNLTSQVFLMQAFAAQRDLPADASIINMLDQQMSAPSPKFFSYAVAKIGLEGATKLAAFELAPHVRVNGIAPGFVLRSGNQTDATFLERQRQMPLREGLGTEDIVGAARYLIASSHVTGEVMLVDSGQRLIGAGNSHLRLR